MASQNRNKKVSLASDIQVMLWGLGDSQTPLLSTAKMIDIVVKKRIDLLIQKADKVPKRRSSAKINVKDVLYAMKDDKSKLSRLLEYLDLKDSLEMNVDDKRMSGFIDFSKSLEQKHNLSKAAALRFLSEIGVNDIEDYMKNDGIVMERKIRADRISRSLDVEDYMEFTKSRALSFVTPAAKRNRFIDWLRSDNNTAAKRLKKCTIDVLAYLAKDTIAELVDLVLFHRKNGRIDVNDLKKPKGDMFTTISMLTATVDKLQEDLSPITPKEIKIAAIHLR